MPPRMVAFDTESECTHENGVETQRWRIGAAIRWRTDLKSSDRREAAVFSTPEDFWGWVSAFCHKNQRTIVWAHNMGHDARISRMFDILPALGYRLEWCNLDRNISSATWRSDHGTIVLADTWTWIPLPLNVIAPQVGEVKYDMPRDRAPEEEWARYCMHDTEILYNVVRVLMKWVSSEHLGNWQPTGAGMAMATWRHKFMNHKVLVHDDADALAAERTAMHTGRAEAWRHGKIYGEKWTEVDLKNAYLRIAADTDVPRKLHMHHGAISRAQFTRLRDKFAVLSRVVVRTSVPCVPYRDRKRHLWPVGEFETWLWDNELSMAMRYGAECDIRECYTYVRAPVLSEWARWTLALLDPRGDGVPPIVRTHVKHCSRALIGRLALRTPCWEIFGTNVEQRTGITHVTFPEEGYTTRFLHVGNDTLIETQRAESRNSMPMITGYIMAECRRILWEAMNECGLDNVGHVDTDSILVNSSGLDRLARAYGDRYHTMWQVKGTWTRIEMYGPRCYYRGTERKTSGVPLKATEVSPGEFEGEQWSSMSADFTSGDVGHVTVRRAKWSLRREDPRRQDGDGGNGRTEPYFVSAGSSAKRSETSPVVDG